MGQQERLVHVRNTCRLWKGDSESGQIIGSGDQFTAFNSSPKDVGILGRWWLGRNFCLAFLTVTFRQVSSTMFRWKSSVDHQTKKMGMRLGSVSLGTDGKKHIFTEYNLSLFKWKWVYFFSCTNTNMKTMLSLQLLVSLRKDGWSTQSLFSNSSKTDSRHLFSLVKHPKTPSKLEIEQEKSNVPPASGEFTKAASYFRTFSLFFVSSVGWTWKLQKEIFRDDSNLWTHRHHAGFEPVWNLRKKYLSLQKVSVSQI